MEFPFLVKPVFTLFPMCVPTIFPKVLGETGDKLTCQSFLLMSQNPPLPDMGWVLFKTFHFLALLWHKDVFLQKSFFQVQQKNPKFSNASVFDLSQHKQMYKKFLY